jgi:hypothetical protein
MRVLYGAKFHSNGFEYQSAMVVSVQHRLNWSKGGCLMSVSLIVGLIALACLVLFFKVMGFLLRLAVIAVLAGIAYWYLAPYLDLPPLPF